MSLSHDPLSLSQTPRAAADARRWVARICRELGREDLVECAQVGTAELVANAILHGVAPISVRVRGTATHPRIEVLDGSSEAPVPASSAVDSDDFLATFGRGLSMVAMSAVAWGASMEDDGKVVWFEPASGVGDHEAATPVFDSHAEPDVESRSDQAVAVSLLGLDVPLATALGRQYADLRRELRLLAVAHQDAYPLAANLSAMFASYERQLPREVQFAVKRARRAGKATIDLDVTVEPEAAPILTTMLEMFDLADAFCKAERLLSIQRTPEQRAFHVWYLSEYTRQIDGQQPVSFRKSGPGQALGNQQVS
ncbi:ATP-binding protein [Nocardioides allogilvus]|uniref:ATP-binding protein n=1 Tax=Nocardioides allogilvus TaxID=2072017 RepID=UPI001300AC71|nr:ATP-binding protein [Nocardioides allogilvus]